MGSRGSLSKRIIILKRTVVGRESRSPGVGRDYATKNDVRKKKGKRNRRTYAKEQQQKKGLNRGTKWWKNL